MSGKQSIILKKRIYGGGVRRFPCPFGLCVCNQGLDEDISQEMEPCTDKRTDNSELKCQEAEKVLTGRLPGLTARGLQVEE